MLIIYSALTLGGIETFIVRMAKERHKSGLVTKVLLCCELEENDKYLINELYQCAEVILYKEITKKIAFNKRRVLLIDRLEKKKVTNLLSGVEHIHSSRGLFLLLAIKLNKIAKHNIPITVGFYHTDTHAKGLLLNSYYEKINSKLVLEHMPKENLFCFSQGVIEHFKKNFDLDLTGASSFRLGVVDKKEIEITREKGEVLKVCSVGRLVSFKTYNINMLKVVSELVERDIRIEYHIYGDGPERNNITALINKLGLSGVVKLKGNLDYKDFDKVVQKYDIFVGSGTAIIQASALGVPSIVGIEYLHEELTYGYFSNVHKYEYNINGLAIDKVPIVECILTYINSNDEERYNLKRQHLDAINDFTNTKCSNEFEKAKNRIRPLSPFSYNKLYYDFSRAISKILNRQ